MYVYDGGGGEEATSEYLVTLDCGTRIDTRLLVRLRLNPPNNTGRHVYAIGPPEYAQLPADELARNIKASQSLRLAIRACVDSFKPRRK